VSPTALALAGSVPIVVVLVLLVGRHWPAARAMAVGWALASALGLLVWRMEPGWWAAAAVFGALQAVEIVLIVLGAVLLMNHLRGSGAFGAIHDHLTSLARDRRVQLLLIGLGLVTLVEGAAGFGTPGAVAAPIMIGLGFPPLAAAVFGLVFNAAQPPFGAAGTPVIGGLGSVLDASVLGDGPEASAFLGDVTAWTALVTGPTLAAWGLVCVFLLALWFGDEHERSLRGALRSTLPVAPLALALGTVAGATQLAVAWLLGPELPDIVAGFVTLGVGVVLVRRGVLVPREPWSLPARDAWPGTWESAQAGPRPRAPAAGDRRARMPVALAWTPYALVAAVLVATRWPGLGLGDLLREPTLQVSHLLGQDLAWSIRPLANPGVVPFLPVALLTVVLHRMDRRSVAAAWRRTGRQLASPALTLAVAVSMAQVMIRSASNALDQPGMMEAISASVAAAAGGLLPAVAPWIGALGAFMTGSSTSSNILFGALQLEAAAEVGVSRTITVALQNAGSGVGNMVAVLNVAVIAAVVGMTGRESRILRLALVPTLLLAAATGAAGMLLVALAPGPW
jgi:lactate permease